MARKKQQGVGFRTTARRMSILKAYSVLKEKSVTSLFEDYIDSLADEVIEYLNEQEQK